MVCKIPERSHGGLRVGNGAYDGDEIGFSQCGIAPEPIVKCARGFDRELRRA